MPRHLPVLMPPQLARTYTRCCHTMLPARAIFIIAAMLPPFRHAKASAFRRSIFFRARHYDAAYAFAALSCRC